MSNQTYKGGLIRKIVKILLLIPLVIAGVLILWHIKYTYSGSNQWELAAQTDEVKLYSLKTPGVALKKYKAITHVNTALSTIVAALQDNDISAELGMIDSKQIDYINPQYFFASFKIQFPGPFQTREYVIKNQFYQNPRTKAVLYEVKAAPDYVPLDDCCVRVAHMNNHWMFTPLENGQVEIEWLVDMNEAGFVPYFLLNVSRAGFMVDILPKIKEIISREKYSNSKFEFIEDVVTG